MDWKIIQEIQVSALEFTIRDGLGPKRLSGNIIWGLTFHFQDHLPSFFLSVTKPTQNSNVLCIAPNSLIYPPKLSEIDWSILKLPSNLYSLSAPEYSEKIHGFWTDPGSNSEGGISKCEEFSSFYYLFLLLTGSFLWSDDSNWDIRWGMKNTWSFEWFILPPVSLLNIYAENEKSFQVCCHILSTYWILDWATVSGEFRAFMAKQYNFPLWRGDGGEGSSSKFAKTLQSSVFM